MTAVARGSSPSLSSSSLAKKTEFDARDGTWSARQQTKKREERLGRLRCCSSCAMPGDVVLGAVYSELPCDRCRAAPCHGTIVVRDSAMSASTVRANVQAEAALGGSPASALQTAVAIKADLFADGESTPALEALESFEVLT